MVSWKVALVVLFLVLFASTTGTAEDAAAKCSAVHDIDDEDDQCHFVQETESCDIESGYINYSVTLFCTFQGSVLRPIAYVVFILWFIYLFLCVSVTSDEIFIPNLAAIAKALRFSENVAGETLLPFGNGAPDIFTSIAAAVNAKNGEISILYGTLLGSGTFITTVIVGTVTFIKPFRANERPFLRVVIFYMASVFTAFTIAWDGTITPVEGAIFLMLYVVYLATVLIGPKLNVAIISWARKRRLAKANQAELTTGDEGTAVEPVNGVAQLPEEKMAHADKMMKISVVDESGQPSTAKKEIPLESGSERPQLSPKVSLRVSDNEHPQLSPKASLRASGSQRRPSLSSSKVSFTAAPAQPSLRKSNSYLELPPEKLRPRASSFGAVVRKDVTTSAAAMVVTREGKIRPRSSSVGFRKPVPPEVPPPQGHHHHHHHLHLGNTANFDPSLSRMAKLLIRQASYQREIDHRLRTESLRSSTAPRSRVNTASRSRTGTASRSRTGTGNQEQPQTQQPLEPKTSLKPEPGISKLEEFFLPRDDDHEDECTKIHEIESPPIAERQHSQTVPPQIIVNSGDNCQETKPKSRSSSSASSEEKEEVVEDKPVWRWLMEGLIPINLRKWKTQNWFTKTLQVLKSPVLFLIYISSPVLDEEKPIMNWNRPLNSLHCITTPLFIMISLKLTDNLIGNAYPIIAIVAAVGAGLGLLVFLTTENTKRPYYHVAFAIIGFVATAMWIYLLANEVVNLIQMFGLAFNISESLLSITFLAWGNSLPDFINDTAVARQGYSKMAISACFGSACFNWFLGLGFPLLLMSLNMGGTMHVELPTILVVMFGFLMFTLIAHFIVIPFVYNFHVKRPFAIFLFVIYAACLICIILAEVKVINFG